MFKIVFDMFVAESALQNYNHMGKGHCDSGYYKGWGNDADQATMDAEKCAVHCNEEPECVYFAVNPLYTCSRYDINAGDCPSNLDVNHELYKKIGTYTMHQVFCVAQTLILQILQIDTVSNINNT